MQGRENGLMLQLPIGSSDLHLHRHTILKGIFRQQFAAERMDRADRDLVEVRRQAVRLFENVANAILQFTGRLFRVGHQQQVLHA